MAREQVLYQLMKLTSTFICEHNCNIDNYLPRQAAADGNLVSCGDNIAFAQARLIHEDTRDYHSIFYDVVKLRAALRKTKREGNQTEARILWYAILKNLFLEDFIIVEAVSKDEYKHLATKGFRVNGREYTRFSASAGNIRHNCVLFCSKDIYPQLYKRLMCGLDERLKETNIAKLSAYFSLSTSSIMWVSNPRVCVIKDFFTTLKDQKIDWITAGQNGKKIVEERIMDFEMNSCDGQGLVSPEQAQKWSQEMGLDYTASSFVVRSIFVKGNVVPFDFKAYAHEHGISTIYDKWGHPYNIDDIDVVLSESQFKMHKYYSSWEEYNRYIIENGIGWGVSRYNKKYDDEYVLANYQIIQVLDIGHEDIKELIQPTIDWIDKICEGNDLFAILFSLGGFSNDKPISYKDVYSRAQNIAMRAVVKDKKFLKDTYVQHKIYKNIVESINKAKIGKIYVKGNYSFMISDPIAQCRSMLGLDPTGEIPGEYVYSNFWNERANEGDEIVLCRCPLLDKHEVNHCTLYRSEEADRWYQWIKSGIIYSIYDLSTIRASDADFDGDIVLTSDNPVLLRGSMKDVTNPISYAKAPVPSSKICQRNFILTDLKGFGTKVGSYSNLSTIFEALRAGMQRPGCEQQNAELLLRKQLLREINGQEIDKIKGVKAEGPPREWTKKQQIFPGDSKEEIEEKRIHNSMVASKKPYFFRYRYPQVNNEYRTHEKLYNEVCKCEFRSSLKALLKKENKTEAEKEVVRNYRRFSPVINTPCTMNTLCKDIEGIDFNIQYDKDCVSLLPYKDLNEFHADPAILKEFRDMYRQYCNKKQIVLVNEIFEGDDPDDYEDVRFAILDFIKDAIQEQYESLNLSPLDGLTYFKILSQSYTKFNWEAVWSIIGEEILDCIPETSTEIPIESADGEEYLGRKFKLTEILAEPTEEIFENFLETP